MSLVTPFLMAATLAANANGATTAYTGSNPVLVTSCSVQPEVNYYDNGNQLYLPEITGAKLNIKFSNSTNKQVASVIFDVTDGSSQTEQVMDSGVFSPGITIAHSFNSLVLDSDHLQCSVGSVAFSDGSTWLRPLVGDAAMK
jgi:hypothetical protein